MMKPKMVWIPILMIAMLSTFVLFAKIDKTKFHPDESGWISSGYYYTDLLLRFDFDWQKWQAPELGAWGYANPHLGKWLLGIPLKFRSNAGEFSHRYDFSKSLQSNVDRGNIPPHDILKASRTGSAIIGAILCVIVFLVGWKCFNVWAGLISAVLVLANNMFTLMATRAMPDVSYAFFLVCLCLCAYVILRHTCNKRVLLGSLAFGVVTGFAFSVKITGIIIGSLFFIAILAYQVLIRKNRTQCILAFAVFLVSSLIVVYVLNPVFWPDFSEIRFSRLILEISSLPEVMNRIVSTHEIPDKTSLERLYPQLANLSHGLIFPVLFVEWNGYMTYQKTLPSANWKRSRVIDLHKSLLFDFSTFFLEWLFIIGGLITGIYALFQSVKQKRITLWSIPLFFFLCNYLFILIFMKLNWARYYLTTVTAAQFMGAVGIWSMLTCSYRLISKKKDVQISAWF